MPIRNLSNHSTYALFFSLLLPYSATLSAASNAEPQLELPDRITAIGRTVQFVVAPIDSDGVVPDVYLKTGPDGAELNDNLDGTRTFNWDADKLGTYELVFIVTDGQYDEVTKNVSMTITVQNDPNIVQSGRIANQISSVDKQFIIGDTDEAVVKILSNLPVSKSQLSVQQTPIDVADGRIYTANIEIGSSGDGRGLPQSTVLRQGVQSSDGSWQWNTATIDDRTIYDEWHTAPSVAIDKAGHIHVAYNMHNMPWQYKRSVTSHQIGQFDFLGQTISEEERSKVVDDNDIDFPTLGSAAIPGNQITYPAFFKDQNEDLHVSYRFAATPGQRFSDRTMSAGVAKYSTGTGEWTALGGNIPLESEDYEAHIDAPTTSTAIAGERGWTAYHPRLLFDNDNQMLVNWFWRLGTGGSRLYRPCLMVSPDGQHQLNTLDGTPVTAPATPDSCGNMGYSDDQAFLTLGNATIDTYGTPYVLLSPEGESRQIAYYDGESGEWIHETAPYSATEIFFDRFNTLWAISTGIKVFKREEGAQSFTMVYDEGEKTNCYPKVKLDAEKQNAFIHTQACDSKSVTIYALSLD